MNLSYWEIKSWLHNIDFTIVGSGIVGLSTALFLKQRLPKSRILILDKGILPQGASTKNAGFACFGSLSEILHDLEHHSEQEVVNLIHKRITGLQLLRQSLGDKAIDYKPYGGYEIFLKNDPDHTTSAKKIDEINALLYPIFGAPVYSKKSNKFNFSGVEDSCIFNAFEGQIDPGKMMLSLLNKVQNLGVKLLNNVTVESFEDLKNSIHIKTQKFDFKSRKLILTTNGFSGTLLPLPVEPARAQVLITKPIANLHIKGTFHLDRGYYYFRNIDNRIVLGGGRNLNFKEENTANFGLTAQIQNELERLLHDVILPDTAFEIDLRWSGIMGVGPQKTPLVFQHSDGVWVGVRMGGMGVAIGCGVGKQISELIQ